MQIKMINVGKTTESFLREGESEYENRIKHYVKFQRIDLKVEKKKRLRKSKERRQSRFYLRLAIVIYSYFSMKKVINILLLNSPNGLKKRGCQEKKIGFFLLEDLMDSMSRFMIVLMNEYHFLK